MWCPHPTAPRAEAARVHCAPGHLYHNRRLFEEKGDGRVGRKGGREATRADGWRERNEFDVVGILLVGRVGARSRQDLGRNHRAPAREAGDAADVELDVPRRKRTVESKS